MQPQGRLQRKMRGKTKRKKLKPIIIISEKVGAQLRNQISATKIKQPTKTNKTQVQIAQVKTKSEKRKLRKKKIKLETPGKGK